MKWASATSMVSRSFILVLFPRWILLDLNNAASHLLSGSISWASFHGTWNPFSATVLLWAMDPLDRVYSDTTVDREREYFIFFIVYIINRI
jgi:hypothetical protein